MSGGWRRKRSSAVCLTRSLCPRGSQVGAPPAAPPGGVPAEPEQPPRVSSALVSWRLVVDRLSVLLLRLLLSLQRLQHLLWWLLELHIVKLVSCYILWVCVKEVRLCCRLSPSAPVCLLPRLTCLSLCRCASLTWCSCCVSAPLCLAGGGAPCCQESVQSGPVW